MGLNSQLGCALSNEQSISERTVGVFVDVGVRASKVGMMTAVQQCRHHAQYDYRG